MLSVMILVLWRAVQAIGIKFIGYEGSSEFILKDSSPAVLSQIYVRISSFARRGGRHQRRGIAVRIGMIGLSLGKESCER